MFKNGHSLGRGGAIHADLGAHTEIIASNFVNNTADLPPNKTAPEDGGVGGAIILDHAWLEVADDIQSIVSLCNFTNNTAYKDAGALAVFDLNTEIKY